MKALLNRPYLASLLCGPSKNPCSKRSVPGWISDAIFASRCRPLGILNRLRFGPSKDMFKAGVFIGKSRRSGHLPMVLGSGCAAAPWRQSSSESLRTGAHIEFQGTKKEEPGDSSSGLYRLFNASWRLGFPMLTRSTLDAFVASFRTHRQFCPAFRPSSTQYVASIGRCHALAEAVLIASLAYRGLECPFHNASVFRWMQPPKFRTAKIVTDCVLPNCLTQRLQCKPQFGRNFAPWRKVDGKNHPKWARRRETRRDANSVGRTGVHWAKWAPICVLTLGATLSVF